MSSGIGNALHELNTFFEPERESRIEIQKDIKELKAESGDLPFDLDSFDRENDVDNKNRE